jgi:hypothetical protein
LAFFLISQQEGRLRSCSRRSSFLSQALTKLPSRKITEPQVFTTGALGEQLLTSLIENAGLPYTPEITLI